MEDTMETIHKDTIKKIFDGMRAELTLWNDPTTGAYILKELEHRLRLEETPLEISFVENPPNKKAIIISKVEKKRGPYKKRKSKEETIFDNIKPKSKGKGSNNSDALKKFCALANKLRKPGDSWQQARARAKKFQEKEGNNPSDLTGKKEYDERKSERQAPNYITLPKNTDKQFICIVCLTNNVSEKGEICRSCEANFEREKSK